MARPAPDVERIFSEAKNLLMAKGEKGLSIRTLASRIGCSPMSLYAHVGKRDDLINGVILRFFRAIVIDIPESGSWQHRVFIWAGKLREALLGFPSIVPLIQPDARWTVETTISRQLYQVFVAAGFEDQHARGLCRTMLWQVMALTMLEAKSESLVTSAKPPSDTPAASTMGESLRENLASRHTLEVADQIFTYTIGLIIDGIEREKRTGRLPTLLRVAG